MFCFESIVRYSEIDAKGQMTLSAVLDLLQDCCTFQSEEAGIGIEFLRQEHRAWVLSSWQVVIERYPKMGEKIRVYTWPYDFKNFMGYRNFKIEDTAENIISYANSVWVYLDTDSGHPVRVPKEVQECYTFEPPYEMERSSRKIRLSADMQPKDPIRVGRFHIDTNQHVNNSKYVMMAEEYLPESYLVRELRAEYKKAAVLSDMIYPKVKETKDNITVALEDEGGNPYAIIEFMEDKV